MKSVTLYFNIQFHLQSIRIASIGVMKHIRVCSYYETAFLHLKTTEIISLCSILPQNHFRPSGLNFIQLVAQRFQYVIFCDRIYTSTVGCLLCKPFINLLFVSLLIIVAQFMYARQEQTSLQISKSQQECRETLICRA